MNACFISRIFFFSTGVDKSFVSVSLDWAVVCIFLIVQCHLVTAYMKLGRNCQGKMLARADCIACEVTGFTAAKRLLYGRLSKLKSDPLYLETGPLQKMLLVG